MFHALLHGKLSREQENMEDLLTSHVFGTLKRLAPHEGLLPWIYCATDLQGNRPLAGIPSTCAVSYEFWPRWSEVGSVGYCEPDVVLDICTEAFHATVAVEAKYRSSKSSDADPTADAPADQLAREWDNLAHVAERNGSQPVLLYITADYAVPRADVEASLDEYRMKRPLNGGEPQIYWLSWRDLPELFRGHASEALRDLAAVARRLDLCYFAGVRVDGEVPTVEWRFVADNSSIDNPAHFEWTMSTPIPTVLWNFKP